MSEKLKDGYKEKIEYIDLTPTWEGLTPILIELANNAETPQARTIAKDELRHMAQTADAYIKARKEGETVYQVLNGHGYDAGNDMLKAIFDTEQQAKDYIEYLMCEDGYHIGDFEIVTKCLIS